MARMNHQYSTRVPKGDLTLKVVTRQSEPLNSSANDADQKKSDAAQAEEHGGFEDRPEPTRFGDWEVKGRCSDF